MTAQDHLASIDLSELVNQTVTDGKIAPILTGLAPSLAFSDWFWPESFSHKILNVYLWPRFVVMRTKTINVRKYYVKYLKSSLLFKWFYSTHGIVLITTHCYYDHWLIDNWGKQPITYVSSCRFHRSMMSWSFEYTLSYKNSLCLLFICTIALPILKTSKQTSVRLIYFSLWIITESFCHG